MQHQVPPLAQIGSVVLQRNQKYYMPMLKTPPYDAVKIYKYIVYIQNSKHWPPVFRYWVELFMYAQNVATIIFYQFIEVLYESGGGAKALGGTVFILA